MSLFETVTGKVKNIREKIEIFKNDHKMANEAISVIIQSLPEPFSKFVGVVWNGIEHQDDAGQKILEMLEKFETKNELLFIKQTASLSTIIEKTANKDDIIELGNMIIKSNESLLSILESKLNEIIRLSHVTNVKLDLVLQKQTELKNSGLRQLSSDKKLSISVNYIGEKGNNYIDKKQFENARISYQLILDNDAHNVNALNNIAYSYYLEEDYSQAEKWYKKAFEVKPDDLHIMNDYCMSLLSQDKQNESLLIIEKILRKKPNDLISLYNKGVILNRKENHKEALDILNKVLEIQPNHVGALTNKGTSLVEIGDLEQGIKILDEALAINPKVTMALNNKAIALSRQKQFKQAEKFFRESLDIEPNNGSALFNLGVIFYDQKRFDEAITYFNKTPTSSEDYIHSLMSKARIYLELKKSTLALECYEKIIKKEPRNADAWAHRGIAFVMANNVNEAITNFQTALKFEPDNYFASENLKRIMNVDTSRPINFELE